jgi:hypothetical protein
MKKMLSNIIEKLTKFNNKIKGVEQQMVELYVVMIQRGLKTIDQVPVRYREQVKELLAAVEE